MEAQKTFGRKMSVVLIGEYNMNIIHENYADMYYLRAFT